MEKKSEYPEIVNKQEVMFIDSTPDENYPLRILQTYRHRCKERWATESDGSCDNPLYRLMNEHQEQRAKLLDKAIAILKVHQRMDEVMGTIYNALIP